MRTSKNTLRYSSARYRDRLHIIAVMLSSAAVWFPGLSPEINGLQAEQSGLVQPRLFMASGHYTPYSVLRAPYDCEWKAVRRVVGIHALLAGKICLYLREITYSHWKSQRRKFYSFLFQAIESLFSLPPKKVKMRAFFPLLLTEMFYRPGASALNNGLALTAPSSEHFHVTAYGAWRRSGSMCHLRRLSTWWVRRLDLLVRGDFEGDGETSWCGYRLLEKKLDEL